MATILIVDDALFVREIIHQICIEEGFKSVFEARDGDQALTLFAQVKPDLVFLDLVLPNKNGVEVAIDMKSAQGNVQIVALSSLTDPQIKQKALQAGCSDFISKPFNRKDIQSFLIPLQKRKEAPKNV